VNQNKEAFNNHPALNFEKSPKYLHPSDLNQKMDQYQEIKNLVDIKSPMHPMTALFQKEANMGLTPFNQISPNHTDLQEFRKTIALCGKHFEQTGLRKFVGQNESESDEQGLPQDVPEFALKDLNKDSISDVHSLSEKRTHKNNPSDVDFLSPLLHGNETPGLFEDLESEKVLGDLVNKEPKNENIQTAKFTKSKSKLAIKNKRVKIGENSELGLCNEKNSFLEAILKPMESSPTLSQRKDMGSSRNGISKLRTVFMKRESSPKCQNSSKNSKNEPPRVRKSSRLVNKEANLEECKGCTCKRSK